ncbi:MAG: hypothetical protein KGY80_12615, partial [Candidatus Thorarchaeota archaeon]|nr:hypothetical protein [Candidatus Thorarchaeota archaeon]
MIAAIIDIVASRDADASERKELDRALRELLHEVDKRFEEYCHAHSSLTQGDSIELLINSWQPIVFLFHNLLMRELRFRVGLGTGKIVIKKEEADECDGPAFWNAREAIDEIKQMKYMARTAGFKIDKEGSEKETNAVVYSLLLLTTFLSLTSTQLEHCYYHIWEGKGISEIAKLVETSKGNVSSSLSKTPCYLLE